MIPVKRLFFIGLAGLLALGLAGCSRGPKYAKVSGVVTLNGKPYKNAIVRFQPLGTQDNPNPGRGSFGQTDESGRFTLTSEDGPEGAVVGKHRVRIVTAWDNKKEGFDPSVPSPDGEPKAKGKVEIDPIPPEWNANSMKEFEVTAEGTDQANFDIVNKKK